MSHDQSQGGPDGQGLNDNGLATGDDHLDLGIGGLGFGGHGDEFIADADRTFEFTVTGATVTAIQAVDGAHTVSLHIPNNATFTVGGGTVTETLTGVHATTVISYAAESGNPALYQVASVTETVTAPSVTSGDGETRGFAFTISGGVVTGEQITSTEQGQTHSVSVPITDALFTVGTGTVTETLVHGDAVETLTFVQPSGQTLYALASDRTTFVAQGAATTALDIEPGERDAFTFGSGGAVTAAEQVHADGSTSAIALGGQVSFTQLAAGLVEEISTHGNHTAFEVFATGPGGGGIYTAVAHGEGSAVDVAGLQAQIAQLPTFFTNVI